MSDIYKTVYLDQNATSYPKLDAYHAWMKEFSQNPAMLNSRSGLDLRELHERIKIKFKLRFKLPPIEYYDLIFTRGATESLNIIAEHIKENFTSNIRGCNIYTNPSVHNALLAPLLKVTKHKLEDIIPVSESPIPFEENVNGNIILVNLRQSFGKATERYVYNLISHAKDSIIVLDASQLINWNYEFNNLNLEKPLAAGCEIFIAFSFHKSLGMEPGAGILVRLSQKWNQKIPRVIYGGIGGSEGFDSLYNYTVSNYPAGTFDPRHYLVFEKLMEERDHNLFLHKDSEARRIFDKIYQFMVGNKAIVVICHDGPTSMATYYHDEYTLGELTQRLDEWLEFEEPGSTFIYRTGKFCCNYFFDYYIPKFFPENINLREGCIRISI